MADLAVNVLHPHDATHEPPNAFRPTTVVNMRAVRRRCGRRPAIQVPPMRPSPNVEATHPNVSTSTPKTFLKKGGDA